MRSMVGRGRCVGDEKHWKIKEEVLEMTSIGRRGRYWRLEALEDERGVGD